MLGLNSCGCLKVSLSEKRRVEKGLPGAEEWQKLGDWSKGIVQNGVYYSDCS